jgi:hypothetical protein
MSKFNPERDGWHLPEAVMHTADGSSLATLHRDIVAATGMTYEPIPWWVHKMAPPPDPPADPPGPPPFIEHNGWRWLLMAGVVETPFRFKLREGEIECWARPSPLAAHVPIPAGAWPWLTIEDWASGLIRHRHDGTRLYAARIKKPTAPTPKKRGGRPCDPFYEKVRVQILDWLDWEGEPETKAEIERKILELCDVSDSTARRWAGEFLADHRRLLQGS